MVEFLIWHGEDKKKEDVDLKFHMSRISFVHFSSILALGQIVRRHIVFFILDLFKYDGAVSSLRFGAVESFIGFDDDFFCFFSMIGVGCHTR
jgi:hypothetical protein